MALALLQSSDIASSAGHYRIHLQPSKMKHDTSILRRPNILILVCVCVFSFGVFPILTNTTQNWAFTHLLFNHFSHVICVSVGRLPIPTPNHKTPGTACFQLSSTDEKGAGLDSWIKCFHLLTTLL